MSLFTPPYLTQLDKAETVLIAGAGGGFDIFSGLPLYFNLIEQGKTVYLANLSFTYLDFFKADRVHENLYKITADTKGTPGIYFPEWYLCQWLKENDFGDIPIYAFAKTGTLPLYKSYQHLVEKLEIDTIVLVDGGTDSLMRGDEDGLGTPGEDYASIAAVAPLNVPRKMLLCLGFGVDHYHGVSNDLSLAAVAELTRSNQFLGSLSILPTMPEAQLYKAAATYVFEQMPNDISIVSSSTLAAIDGHYGDHHSTPRTRGSVLWINPLMAMYWFFDLHGIAQRNQHLESIYITEQFSQVVRQIMVNRKRHYRDMRQRGTIPN